MVLYHTKSQTVKIRVNEFTNTYLLLSLQLIDLYSFFLYLSFYFLFIDIYLSFNHFPLICLFFVNFYFCSLRFFTTQKPLHLKEFVLD